MTMDGATRIMPYAMVMPDVRLGVGCVVHPFSIVGMQPMESPVLARQPIKQIPALIGDDVVIGPHVVIYAGTVIGDQCFIGNHASIREGVRMGARCVIGRNVTINYDAVIEDDVHIQDGTHITGGAFIGRGSFIGVNVTTANDKRREIVDYKFVGITPPWIGSRVLIGSGACIVPGVRIGDGAVVGAGALVTKDVEEGGTVLGKPAGPRETDAARQLAMLRSQAAQGLQSAHTMAYDGMWR
jgi:UDP-3-O-[3-hydroxymyristoyl] glucosamine N-acyltransferase